MPEKPRKPKKPRRPGYQFVVRVEPELARKVKAKAKTHGKGKTEPYIRQVLEAAVKNFVVPADPISNATALGLLVGRYSADQDDVPVPEFPWPIP